MGTLKQAYKCHFFMIHMMYFGKPKQRCPNRAIIQIADYVFDVIAKGHLSLAEANRDLG